MQNTKKLLSITNLKKYFPIKQNLYVRANEDITLDIYEGETLGIVGESGCGKSTLGRVILQLYPQTAGSTMYYGTTVDEITPDYFADTIKNLTSYKKKLDAATAKRIKAEEKVLAVGEDNADFVSLQSRNLARCEEQTCLNAITKVIGGLFADDIPDEKKKNGLTLMLSLFNISKEYNKLLHQKAQYDVEADHISAKKAEGISNNSKKEKLEGKQNALAGKLHKYNLKISNTQKELDELRASLMVYPEFSKYEAMRDVGIDLSRLHYNEMRGLRKDLQIVFQDPYSSLNPRMTIGQIIEEGLITHGFFKRGSPNLQKYVIETLKKCGLQDYMIHRYPHQFSGGQRQRVSIARSLAVKPKFVVCDECVSALDVSIQSQIINLLQELKEKEKLTYMFISHDLSVIKYISDRICVMYLGSVVELTTSDDIFADPRHPYTVALLSSVPTTDVDDLKRERIILEGSIPSPIKPPSGCKFHTRCYMACEKCKRVPPELKEIEPGHFVACHFPERKLDENGNYLFDIKNTERKVNRSNGEDSVKRNIRSGK